MANDRIKSLTFNEQNSSDIDVLDMINDLADLEERKPHDAARRLILEAGKDRIAHLRQEVKGKVT